MRPVADIPTRSPVLARATLWRAAVWALVMLPLGSVFQPAPAALAEEHDHEAVPPAVFFPEPDAQTEEEIRELIVNSFGDQNKTVEARRLLLDRYRLMALPLLLHELHGEANNRSKNQSGLWNSVLTVGAMRSRYGPAPQLWPTLPPLLRILRSQAVYERVFAALALGNWHWAEMEDTPDRKPDSDIGLTADPTPRMRDDLRKTGGALSVAVLDDNPQVRKAAAFALAKRGGGTSAIQLFDATRARGQDAASEVRWAYLLARGFLRPRTAVHFIDPFTSRNSDNNLRRAAALGMSVAMLQEGPTGELLPWVQDHSRVLQALRRAGVHPVDGPEVVFARGVLAWTNQLHAEWADLLKIAVDSASNEQTALAAAQALLFCGEPTFLADATKYVLGQTQTQITHDSVVAAFLLVATAQGTTRGIEAASRFLKSRGLRPKGRRDWDVRFHAAVGLTRAFAAGRITGAGRRNAAVEALRGGRRSIHREAPFRAALSTWLQAEAPLILKDPNYRPDADGVIALERSFTCPHALLSRDLVDVCVFRANYFARRVFGAHNVQAQAAGSPEKTRTPLLFLRSYLEAYPYFTRLEFRWRRGARDHPGLQAGDVGIDR